MLTAGDIAVAVGTIPGVAVAELLLLVVLVSAADLRGTGMGANRVPLPRHPIPPRGALRLTISAPNSTYCIYNPRG